MQPLTIFFIWLGSVLPEHYDQKFKQCLANYDGNCRLIGEKQQVQLVRKYDVYHPNNTVIQRADVLRLLIMQEYGGIYMDFDVEINDWNYLKILQCQNSTFFCEEQIALLNERLYKVGNWMICSGKNTTELTRLIKGITPIHQNPTIKEILDYAGPGYLVNQKAPYMIVYPNIKHCYTNNWTVKRQGCVTPLYSFIDYYGKECFWLMGTSWILILLALYFSRKYIFKWLKVAPVQTDLAVKDYESEHLQSSQV